MNPRFFSLLVAFGVCVGTGCAGPQNPEPVRELPSEAEISARVVRQFFPDGKAPVGYQCYVHEDNDRAASCAARDYGAGMLTMALDDRPDRPDLDAWAAGVAKEMRADARVVSVELVLGDKVVPARRITRPDELDLRETVLMEVPHSSGVPVSVWASGPDFDELSRRLHALVAGDDTAE